MRSDLRQSAAIVTGGARGIGRGIALELARAGASVVVADRDQADADIVVDEIRASGREAMALTLDVADVLSVERCVANAIQRFGRIDALVNNAGIFQNELGLDLDDAGFNHCLDVNLTGMWRMARAMVPHFRACGGGKIINIASAGGRLGVGFAPAYCASKAGVINLTQSLAIALGADNVNVNTVCPGAIATTMQEEIQRLRERCGGGTPKRTPPLAGPLTASDIGHAVVFLASDSAKNITGQALNVDCGYHMS